MKQLITAVAAMGAIAFAAVATADEVKVQATPGTVRVKGDFGLSAAQCAMDTFFLTIEISTPAFVVQVPSPDGGLGEGFSFSAREPGLFGLDVAVRACEVKFSLRVNDSNMELSRGDVVTVSVDLTDAAAAQTIFRETLSVEVPGRMSAAL